MDDTAIRERLRALYDDFEDNLLSKRRPLLAHYTSIQGATSIFESNSLWFSNPLNMNDIDEVVAAMQIGREAILRSEDLRLACASQDRHSRFLSTFDMIYSWHKTVWLNDTYVFCFSEHDENDEDGRLSMWHGYGNEGNGAAIIFDTKKLNINNNSPLIVAPVEYKSRQQMLDWAADRIALFSRLLSEMALPDPLLFNAAHYLFERLKWAAMYSKNRGFIEEREWRVVFFPERDQEKKFSAMLSFSTGPSGIEPRLKLPLGPPGPVSQTLDDLVGRIILGPTTASPLARIAFSRMLVEKNHPHLQGLVTASSIPYRHPIR